MVITHKDCSSFSILGTINVFVNSEEIGKLFRELAIQISQVHEGDKKKRKRNRMLKNYKKISVIRIKEDRRRSEEERID